MSDHGDEVVGGASGDEQVSVLRNRLTELEELQETAEGSTQVDLQREAADLEDQLALLVPCVSQPITVAEGPRRSTRVSRSTEKLAERQDRDREKSKRRLMSNVSVAIDRSSRLTF